MEPAERPTSARVTSADAPPPPSPSTCHASEGAALVEPLPAPSLAALLTAHVLRDGEVVLLVCKPSLWLILFQCIRFTAAVILAYLVARVFGDRLHPASRYVSLNAAVFLVAGRLMWATVAWMGRFYVLTDLRVIRVGGVFTIHVYECALRKVAAVQITYSVKERVCRVGSIEIHPKDSAEGAGVGVWQTVGHPVEVHEQICAAVRRAQNGVG